MSLFLLFLEVNYLFICLLNHIRIYEAKGFQVSSVTSDPEPSIVALKTVLQQSNITLNVLGRGSHAHHAESAIRHIQKQYMKPNYSVNNQKND
jgi:hypothetical protein